MKNAENVVNYYYNGDMKPDKIRDKIVYGLAKRKIIQVTDEWPIEKDMSDGSRVACGCLAVIQGPRFLVNFLSWLTSNHFSKGNPVDIHTSNGKITYVKEESG